MRGERKEKEGEERRGLGRAEGRGGNREGCREEGRRGGRTEENKIIHHTVVGLELSLSVGPMHLSGS
jgi:hypothetical protein